MELLETPRIKHYGTVPMSAAMFRAIGVTLFAVVTATLNAQESKDGKKKGEYDPGVEKVLELKFEDTDRGLNTLAAIAVAQPWWPNPLGIVGERVVASQLVPLADPWHFVFEKALPLDQQYLAAIKDGRPLPDMQLRLVSELKGSDLGIYWALNRALHLLRQSSDSRDVRTDAAADNQRVISASLNKQPGEHRGKVVSVTGKLVAIREADAPRLVLG